MVKLCNNMQDIGFKSQKEEIKFKLKNDKYRRKRGGEAHFIDIYCINCNNFLLKYQKDGKGTLQRCYLNRIFYPQYLERLQYNPKIKGYKDLPNLICQSCNTVIGTPMLHHDGRLAFKLRKGLYFKKRVF
ncbi:hypothetical protein HY498_04770 [Candidatus Woesearchaeota archaeon]|nr:hypothetical protein [Candidatus Woesearchaeota archaeon]